MHTQNCCAAKPPNLEALLYSPLVTANEEGCKFFLVLFHNLFFIGQIERNFTATLNSSLKLDEFDLFYPTCQNKVQ
jgi:hypothetical protein